MPDFTLLGTDHCHLCEEAESILRQAGLSYASVDIADDDDLMNTYSLRIPVLRRTHTGKELNWPFSLPEILAFAAG